MQNQGHEVTLKIVPLPGQKQDTIPRLGTEFQFQLDVLVCGLQRGKRKPAGTCEPGRSYLGLCKSKKFSTVRKLIVVNINV